MSDVVADEPIQNTQTEESPTLDGKAKKGKASTKNKKVAASKKPKKSVAPSSHPKYSVMIVSAIKALKERNGSSRQAILKYITANYKVEPKKAAIQLRLSLKRAISNGSLKMAKEKGKGAGCYKVADVAENNKKKGFLLSASKKPAAADKIKKSPIPKAAKKPVTVKKPAVKKSVAKKSAKKPVKKVPKKGKK